MVNLKPAMLGLIAFICLACQKGGPGICSDCEIAAPKIILIVGQSNTHAGLGFDEALDAPAHNIYQLGRFADDYCVVQACEPLDHHTRYENLIGFGLKFSKLLSEFHQQKEDILIIPCGYGGTGFADNHWNKGNDLYEDAVSRVNAMTNKYPNSEITAILWHQGETDVILGNQHYQENLDDFILNLRTDIGADSVPFILGGMVPYWVDQASERQDFQQLIKSTTQRIGKTGYADPEVPFRIMKPDDTFDEIHYDANGQRELAQRYFDEFLRLSN